MELEGKAAIVTGAGTGVGRATALKLAARGCSVIVNYSRSKDAAEEVASAVRQAGVGGVAVRADVSQDADCRRLVDTATDEFGRLDVLVNNAGTTSFIPHTELDKVTQDDWSQILGVNLIGPFQCTRAARAALKADGGGEVVMISSVAGVYATGSSIPYCCSKAALNNLTLSLARVMGPEVRVNAVAPGFIDGSWLQGGLGAAFEPIKKAYEQKSLVGRVSTPDSVAEAVLAFVTGSDLVTAQVLVHDGGAGLSG